MKRSRKRDGAQEKLDQLVKLLKQGIYTRHACAIVGIPYRTLYNWMAEEPELREAVENAADTAMGICEQVVLRAAQRDWKAAAWFLERRKPHLYGRYVKIDISKLSTEELEELISTIDEKTEIGE